MSFSNRQQGHYRPLKKRAWLAECSKSGEAPNNKKAEDIWYRKQLIEVGGWFTTKECDGGRDFDALMLHFAEIANDEYWINKAAYGNEKRIKWWIRKHMKDLSFLEERPVTWDYIKAIYHHAQLPLTIDECPAEILQQILQILDTHVRRLCKRKGIRPMNLPGRKKQHD